jgi:hypothetical protein
VAEILTPFGSVATPFNIKFIPFIFSDTDTILMVFTSADITMYKYDSTTGRSVWLGVTIDSGSSSLPWSDDDIATIKHSQSGDVVTITTESTGPYELTRTSTDSTTWTLYPADFTPEEFPTGYGGGVYLYAYYNPTETEISPFNDDRRIFDKDDSDFTEDASYPARRWDWAVSRVLYTNGKTYETQAQTLTHMATWSIPKWNRYALTYIVGFWVHYKDSNNLVRTYKCLVTNGVNTPAGVQEPVSGGNTYWQDMTSSYQASLVPEEIPEWVAVYATKTVKLIWPQYSLLTSGDNRILRTRVYRGRDGRFGYIGETESFEFLDEGGEPDFSIPPKTAELPFNLYDENGDVSSTEVPSIVTHIQGRRLFASTPTRPASAWASAVDEYSNFQEIVPAKDSDSYGFELASGKFEKIRAIIARQQMLIFTDFSEWLVTGAGGGLLSPNSLAAQRLSEYGSSTVTPLTFGDSILFLQQKGTVPRVMTRGELDTLHAYDLSIISRHLFTEYGIVSWCYAEDPWQTVWAVRSDGALLSCTFAPDQQMFAWTRHELDGGEVVEIASVPEGYEDAVYVAVKRGSRYYLERFASRVITDIKDAVFLDAATSWDGRNTDTTATITVTSIAAARDRYATVNVVIGETVAGEYDGGVVRVYSADDDEPPVDLDMTYSAPIGVYTAQLLEPLHESLDGVATSEWAEVRSWINYDHFGEEVYALLDGNVAGPFTSGPSVTLPYRAAVIQCGIPYNCDFESLDMVHERNKKKVAKAVALQTYGSRGGHVGITLDADDLEEIRTRQVSHGFDPIPLLSDEQRILIPSRWEENGRVAYRQSSPLPIEILGITREVEIGG